MFVLADAAAAVELEQGGAEGPLATLPVTLVTRRVAEKISTLETPPPVISVFAALQPPPLAALRSPALLAVYADRVADPGNLGTLVRAAAAFGAAALITSPGCADLFAPKVVRAGMGAVFALPLYQNMAFARVRRELTPVRAYGLVAHEGGELGNAELSCPAIVCVGAERSGLAPEVQAQLDERLTIRLRGGAAVESLNAGVAGAIALYEFARRADATTTSGV